MEHSDRILGCLLGGAVGDAIGLPHEGLTRRRIALRLGSGPIEHALIFRRGMLSDDTEHACMTAQAMLRAPDDPDAFMRSLAWRLRLWLLGLPAAIGLGTLRALIRLWLGWPPTRSGVGSAGNGPAMRAAILGACLGHDPERLRSYVERSTRMTHSDPRALAGALAIAGAAAQIVHHPRQINRLLAQIAADRRANGVARVEDQVDHHQHRIKPVCDVVRTGHHKRNTCRRDFRFCPRQTRAHRGVAIQKSRRNFRG